MTESKDEEVVVAARMPRSLGAQFGEIAERHNMSVSALLRELVSGMIENRITIAPPKHVLYSLNSDKE